MPNFRFGRSGSGIGANLQKVANHRPHGQDGFGAVIAAIVCMFQIMVFAVLLIVDIISMLTNYVLLPICKAFSHLFRLHVMPINKKVYLRMQDAGNKIYNDMPVSDESSKKQDNLELSLNDMTLPTSPKRGDEVC